MSDPSPDRVTGGIHDASVAEMSAQAGRDTSTADPINELRDHCRRFIEGANLSQHARMQALPKLDEMIFWIRAGAGRG